MVVVAAAELIFDDDDAAISVFGDEIDADIPCRALFARVGEFQVHHAAKLVDVLVEPFGEVLDLGWEGFSKPDPSQPSDHVLRLPAMCGLPVWRGQTGANMLIANWRRGARKETRKGPSNRRRLVQRDRLRAPTRVS